MSGNAAGKSTDYHYCVRMAGTSISVKLLRTTYSKDFNFYYTKSLNEILNGFRSRADLMYRDWLMLSESNEVLRRYYTQNESDVRLNNYAKYYSEIEDYQLPCLEKVASRSVLFKRKKRKFKYYQRLPEQVMEAERRARQGGEARGRRFLRRLAQQTIYLEDIFLEQSTSDAECAQSDHKNDMTLPMCQSPKILQDSQAEVHDIFNPVFSSEEDEPRLCLEEVTDDLELSLSKSDLDSVSNLSLVTKISCLERVSTASICKPKGQEVKTPEQMSILELRDRLDNYSDLHVSEPRFSNPAPNIGIGVLGRVASPAVTDLLPKFRRRIEPARSIINGSKGTPKAEDGRFSCEGETTTLTAKQVQAGKKLVKAGIMLKQENQLGGESVRARSNCSKRSSSMSSTSKTKTKKCLFNFSSRLKDKLRNGQLLRRQGDKGPNCVDSLIGLLHLKSKIDINCNAQASRDTLKGLPSGKSFSETIFETHLSTGPLCQTDRLNPSRNPFRTHWLQEEQGLARPSSIMLSSVDERTRVSLSSYMSPALKKSGPDARESTIHRNSHSNSSKPNLLSKSSQRKKPAGNVSHRHLQLDIAQTAQKQHVRIGGSWLKDLNSARGPSQGLRKQLTHLRFEHDFSEGVTRGLVSPTVDSRFTPISRSKVYLGQSKTASRKENKVDDFNYIFDRPQTNMGDILKAFKQKEIGRALVRPAEKLIQRKSKEVLKHRTSPQPFNKCIS